MLKEGNLLSGRKFEEKIPIRSGIFVNGEKSYPLSL